MSSQYSTIRQHEPLRAPAGWSAQEKRFVAQLEEILDDLYSRFGRLREEDMGRPLRESIAKSERGVSELRQDSRSFTAAFESIGTMGTQTGATRIDENGLEVCHSDIAHTTTLAADGMKIRDADGNVVGGVYAVGGEVKSAMQSLFNPQNPDFEVTVRSRNEGETNGLYLLIGGVHAGSLAAGINSGGETSMNIASGQYLGLSSGGKMVLHCGGELRIGNDRNYIVLSEAGDGRIVFTGQSGGLHTILFEELAALLPND